MRPLAILLLCLAPLAAHAQTDPVPRMQQIVANYTNDKSFMGSVLVVKDGHTLIDQGYGSADLEWNIPNSPATKFRLGSITKQFTAASILLLQERGKLSIDDPVSKYMPDAPAAWSKITIYNVLTHTSGIPSFTGFPDYRTTEWKDTTPAELVARFRDKPLDFEPGTKFNYSNSGYVLLGYLIEKSPARPTPTSSSRTSSLHSACKTPASIPTPPSCRSAHKATAARPAASSTTDTSA
jgi:CubicO group peptidase (beta-lactamase class C family)